MKKWVYVYDRTDGCGDSYVYRALAQVPSTVSYRTLQRRIKEGVYRGEGFQVRKLEFLDDDRRNNSNPDIRR